MKLGFGIVALLFLCGCYNNPSTTEWEDGVFWGFMAAKNGATYSNCLVKAYEARAKAEAIGEKDKKTLDKYR